MAVAAAAIHFAVALHPVAVDSVGFLAVLRSSQWPSVGD